MQILRCNQILKSLIVISVQNLTIINLTKVNMALIRQNNFCSLQMKKITLAFFLFVLKIASICCRTSINFGGNILSPTPFTSSPFTATINKTSYGQEYQVDLSVLPAGCVYSFKFQITNASLLTTTFLAVSTSQTQFKAGYISHGYFYRKRYADLEGRIDMINMNLMQKNRIQYINRKRSSQNTIYLTVYNLDPAWRRVDVQFKITFSFDTGLGSNSTKDCFDCNSGSRSYPGNSCICRSCAAGFYGPDCSINMLTLTNGQPTTAPVTGPAMAFFKIQGDQQVTILVKTSAGSAQVYFQFIQFDGQFASYTNVAVTKSLEGRFNATAGTSGTTISATSSGTPMSITVAVYQIFTTQIEISYTVPQKSSVLVIVLGVLGGVLFIGLVIAAVYILRNANFFNQNRQVRPVRPISQDLTDEEVQRFFPTVLLSSINRIGGGETSMQQLNQNQKRQTVQDCAICLEPIQPTQQIKVTYCKHIFHSQCLIGWFKKQQNCPNCRQQFTKANTVKLYKKIKELNNNAVMKGQQLANGIILAKTNAISSKQSLQNLIDKEGNNTKATKIQPNRNQIDIQDMNS